MNSRNVSLLLCGVTLIGALNLLSVAQSGLVGVSGLEEEIAASDRSLAWEDPLDVLAQSGAVGPTTSAGSTQPAVPARPAGPPRPAHPPTSTAPPESLAAQPDVPAPSTRLPRLRWELLKRTTIDQGVQNGRQGVILTYPAELNALAGREVELIGAGFVFQDSARAGQIESFVMMEASMLSCCGPACTPTLTGVVLVHCDTAPIPQTVWPEGGRIASVVGRLRLGHPDDLGCPFGLADARVRLRDPTGRRVVFDGLRERLGQ